MTIALTIIHTNQPANIISQNHLCPNNQIYNQICIHNSNASSFNCITKFLYNDDYDADSTTNYSNKNTNNDDNDKKCFFFFLSPFFFFFNDEKPRQGKGHADPPLGSKPQIHNPTHHNRVMGNSGEASSWDWT